MWKKRSGELSHCTTQTALPTLNQQHSSPVHPAFPLLFLAVQEETLSAAAPTPCRCTGQLWLWRLALTHWLAQGKQHMHKTQGAVTSSDCGSWWKTWMNTQMNTWMEEWIKDRTGWDRGREWQDKKQDAGKNVQQTNAYDCLGKCDSIHQCQRWQICW